MRNAKIILGLLARLARNESLGLQIQCAVKLAFTQTQIGPGLLKFGALHRIVDTNQNGTFLDALTLAKQYLLNPAGDLRADNDRLV